MPLIPANLPLWAYLAAGGAAFAATRIARSGGSGPAGGSGGTGPAATPPATADVQAAASSDLWGSYGDQGAQFGAGGQQGSIGYSQGGDPAAGGGYSLSDLLGGQPIGVTLQDPFGAPIENWPVSTMPIGTITPIPAPTATAPAPTYTAPAPTSTTAPTSTIPSSIGPKPAGAAAWVVANGLKYLYHSSGGVLVKGPAGSLHFTAWTTAEKTMKTPFGTASFRGILSGVHKGYWIHTSDAGLTWHYV